MVEPEQKSISPYKDLRESTKDNVGTPLSSFHGSTHYLQMTKLQYVNSSTIIELEIKNDNRQINPQLPEYHHSKQNCYGIMHQPNILKKIFYKVIVYWRQSLTGAMTLSFSG